MFRLNLLAWIAAPLLLPLFAVAQSGEDRNSQIAAALREEQFDKALGMIRAALQDVPANPQLWTMQGVAYNGVGKTTEALSSFRHALKLSPDSVPALKGAPQFEYDQGDAAGIPVLEHLLRLVPNDLTSHGMLAILDFHRGNCGA